jgi:hypothetical protein
VSENDRRTFLNWRLPFLACLCARRADQQARFADRGRTAFSRDPSALGVEIDESAIQCGVEMSMPDSLIADHCHEWREHQDN